MMNSLLNNYSIQVNYPDVSGAEQLEMLTLRDQIFQNENLLNSQEKQILSDADQQLIANASQIYTELSKFIDLIHYRETQKITPQQWWWYLDVISRLPKLQLATQNS